MIYFTDHDIDRLIEDDVPAGDMTSLLLGLQGQKGQIEIFARDTMIVCCTEEADRMYRKVGLKVLAVVPSGTKLNAGDKLLEAEGDAQALHLIWRTGGAMIEFASGIAGRTRQLVDLAQVENPAVSVAGTRKHPPYLKKVALKALMAGGGVPHRTGLSDTILLFREHLLFAGGYDNLPDIVSRIKTQQKERKVVVEAHSASEALQAVTAGADAVQLDKLAPGEFARVVSQCKKHNKNICMVAAGGINAGNAGAYARAGADVLVSSWMYFAPPADIRVKISPVG
jgi:molybdenum transport protein